MNARKFLFADFGAPARGSRTESNPAAGEASLETARLEALEREIFARGVAEGRRQAELENTTERRLADAMQGLAAGTAGALGALDGHVRVIEESALVYFHALAAKLAGAALEAEPLRAVAEAASEAFRHLRGVPHLVVRTDPAQVEAVDRLLHAMVRENGFEGRIIVLGDDDLAAGDARLEWADGGVLRSRHALEEAADRLLADILAFGRPSADPSTHTEET